MQRKSTGLTGWKSVGKVAVFNIADKHFNNKLCFLRMLDWFCCVYLGNKFRAILLTNHPCKNQVSLQSDQVKRSMVFLGICLFLRTKLCSLKNNALITKESDTMCCYNDNDRLYCSL